MTRTETENYDSYALKHRLRWGSLACLRNVATVALFCALSMTSVHANQAGFGKGAAEHFTGTVHVKRLFGPMAPSPMVGASAVPPY